MQKLVKTFYQSKIETYNKDKMREEKRKVLKSMCSKSSVRCNENRQKGNKQERHEDEPTKDNRIKG